MPRFLLIDPEHLVNLDQVAVIEFHPKKTAEPGDQRPFQSGPARIDFHSLSGDIFSVEGYRALALWTELTSRYAPGPAKTPTIEELNRASLEALSDDGAPEWCPECGRVHPLSGPCE